MPLRIVPLTLKQANELVASWHRHHKPVVGHRFSLGADKNGELVGAVIVGRPVSRELDQYRIAEVTRLVANGEPHVCSMLYAAAARVAKEMGFDRIQTYILESEPGTSVAAAGWERDGNTAGGNWNHSWRKGRREDQPMQPKQRWVKVFRAAPQEPQKEVFDVVWTPWPDIKRDSLDEDTLICAIHRAGGTKEFAIEKLAELRERP